ncbi:methyltransferase domain-containing protein [bacterium]|nr:methyltransferase domain-containing protein [bacterium]
MASYDEMAGIYDQMIRWKSRLERETPFLQRLFAERRIHRVLDLGCGTGKHARLFHKWGCEVVGVDASAKLLESAREQFKDDAENITFVHADFAEFVDKVKGPFDAVLSLGNSLPHVRDEVELKQTLSSIYTLLKPEGVFVFQNRNYDRLLKTGERFLLPLTHRQADNEQIFFRFNDFKDHKVQFNVVHFTRVGEGWIHEVHSMDLEPIRQEVMESLLRESGFTALNFYGDFSGTPFDPETSADLVGLVRKPKDA